MNYNEKNCFDDFCLNFNNGNLNSYNIVSNFYFYFYNYFVNFLKLNKNIQENKNISEFFNIFNSMSKNDKFGFFLNFIKLLNEKVKLNIFFEENENTDDEERIYLFDNFYVSKFKTYKNKNNFFIYNSNINLNDEIKCEIFDDINEGDVLEDFIKQLDFTKNKSFFLNQKTLILNNNDLKMYKEINKICDYFEEYDFFKISYSNSNFVHFCCDYSQNNTNFNDFNNTRLGTIFLNFLIRLHHLNSIDLFTFFLYSMYLTIKNSYLDRSSKKIKLNESILEKNINLNSKHLSLKYFIQLKLLDYSIHEKIINSKNQIINSNITKCLLHDQIYTLEILEKNQEQYPQLSNQTSLYQQQQPSLMMMENPLNQTANGPAKKKRARGMSVKFGKVETDFF